MLSIKNKILNKKAIITIFGLGYVGFPIFESFAKLNYNVIGYDTNKNKINEIKSRFIKKKNRRIVITNDSQKISNSDIFIICVPTPLNENFEPDTSFIKSVIKKITNNKKKILIILESTCYPGCTEELVVAPLKKKGLKLSKNLFVSFSPERIDPANKKYYLNNIPKVIGSKCKTSLYLTNLLYSKICKKTITLNSFAEAEMSKLLENVYRQINIGLINEMAMMCEKLKINIWNVIEASSSKPFGFKAFYPGPGTGGHCIPLDPMYLYWKAKSKNFFSRFIQVANDVNQNMPNYILNRISNNLNKKSIPLKNSKILVIGVSYKKNVSDCRESPSIKIIELLLQKSCIVSYHDNYVRKISVKIENNKNTILYNTNIKNNPLREFDLVVILTDHDYINWKKILKESKLIFDTRNVFKKNIISKIELL
jgi:UDP-N-acetyl-D-glucosamine dehydrogenase